MEKPSSNAPFTIFGRLQYLFSNPTYFFTRLQQEKSIKAAFLTYLGFAILLSLPTYLLPRFTSGALGADMFSTGYGSVLLLFPSIVGLLLTFIYSAMIHGLVKLFKGTGNYVATYNVYTYSALLTLLFGLIPFVGFFAGLVYTVVLITIGLSVVHRISMGKSVVACILPAIFVVGLIIILAVSFYRHLYS